MRLLYIFFFTTILLTAQAQQTLEWVVVSSEGEVLPFATLRLEPSGLSTLANEEGQFAVTVPVGDRELRIQYIGFQTHQHILKPGESTLRIVMTKSVIQLGEVQVTKSNEDPAISIMRKTLAMSPIHFKEVVSYRMKNYVRVSVKVDKVPFLLKKQLKENFVTLGQTYILESVKELGFAQPQTYTERVLSVRSNIPPQYRGQEGVSFRVGNLYDPENKTSPVTAAGSKNYRYEYVGYFEDQGQLINKIKVIPRYGGRGLWEGTIHILEDSWYVHGVEVKIPNPSGVIDLKVVYGPIQGVWLPIQSEVSSKVDYLGFELTNRAVTSFRGYQVKLDPKYAALKPTLADPKKGPVSAGQVSVQAFSKEVKKQLKKDKSKNNFQIENWRSEDTLARKRDSLFWEAERMIPLTSMEVKGFKEADSLYEVQEVKIKARMKDDSLTRLGKTPLKWSALMEGYTFRRGRVDPLARVSPFRHTFSFGGLVNSSRYTAVEGFQWGLPSISYRRFFDSTTTWSHEIKGNYAFGKKQWNGLYQTRFQRKNWQIDWRLGREINQINPVVSDAIASFYLSSLNRVESYFFQETYQRLGVQYQLDPRWKFEAHGYVGYRNTLENVIDQSAFYRKGREPLPANRPNHQRLGVEGTGFENHWMTKISGSIVYQPGAREYRQNGQSFRINRGPIYALSYQGGMGAQGFHRLEAQTQQRFQWAGNILQVQGAMGTFLGRKPTYFLDYKHFQGNELLVQTHTGFRALPVYFYSADGGFLEGRFDLQMPKFLVSQLPFVQKKGWSETIYLGGLRTSGLPYHLEAGYGFKHVTSGFRLEGFGSWTAGAPSAWGVRMHLPMF